MLQAAFRFQSESAQLILQVCVQISIAQFRKCKLVEELQVAAQVVTNLSLHEPILAFVKAKDSVRIVGWNLLLKPIHVDGLVFIWEAHMGAIQVYGCIVCEGQIFVKQVFDVGEQLPVIFGSRNFACKVYIGEEVLEHN